MKKYKVILIITYFLLAICGFATDYFYNIMPQVILTKAQVGRVVDTVSYTGTVQAREIHVFSSMPARVVHVYVNSGQYVKQGDLLARLDLNDTSVDKIRQEAQSGVSFGAMVDEHVFSEILSAVESTNDIDAVRMNSAAIRAPMDGYVTNVSVNAGDYADIITPIFAITDRSQMRVRIQVSEDRISEIMPGQPVTITGSGFNGQSYYGYVEQIADRASQSLLDKEGAKIMVDISLNHPDNCIMPGFTATATIRLRTRDSVVKIPLELIDQDDTGKEFVWIFQDGIVHKRYINCKYTAYGYAEVSQFDVGQWVVEQYSATLRDGIPVQLAQEWNVW